MDAKTKTNKEITSEIVHSYYKADKHTLTILMEDGNTLDYNISKVAEVNNPNNPINIDELNNII